MAKKRSKKSRGMTMQPAITDLYFEANPATDADPRFYVDTARELSRVNRRLYSQTRMFGYQGLTFIWKAKNTATPPALTDLATIEVKVATAGNTWVVQNAYTKGHALWNEMQDLVLDDNPSVKGKWHDFKCQLVGSQSTVRTLNALDGAGVPYTTTNSEWNISTYVMPQHDVDTTVPGTGTPLPAVELTPLLVGDDTATKRSLVKAYEESRATVSKDQPNTPAALSGSFFSLLTDSGSQEPELATVIADENEDPPYDLNKYPGGAVNANVPSIVGYGAISSAEVDGRIGGFVAPCGLLEISVRGYDSQGNEVPSANMPKVELLLHVAPGAYKGVAAIPMGQ
jgi:hypothetical protein